MVVRSNCRESPDCVMRKPPLSMIRAVVASLRSRNPRNTSSSCWISSSMSWGKVAMSCVLRLALVDVLVEQHAGDHVERFENALALVRGGRERRHLHFAVVKEKFHVLHRRGIGQVAFIVLKNVRDSFEIQLQALEVVREILEALDVLRHFLILRIRD